MSSPRIPLLLSTISLALTLAFLSPEATAAGISRGSQPATDVPKGSYADKICRLAIEETNRYDAEAFHRRMQTSMPSSLYLDYIAMEDGTEWPEVDVKGKGYDLTIRAKIRSGSVVRAHVVMIVVNSAVVTSDTSWQPYSATSDALPTT